MERLDVYGRCTHCLEIVVLYQRKGGRWWLVHLDTHYGFEDDRSQYIGQRCNNFELFTSGAPVSTFYEMLIGAYDTAPITQRKSAAAQDPYIKHEIQNLEGHDPCISKYFK